MITAVNLTVLSWPGNTQDFGQIRNQHRYFCTSRAFAPLARFDHALFPSDVIIKSVSCLFTESVARLKPALSRQHGALQKDCRSERDLTVGFDFSNIKDCEDKTRSQQLRGKEGGLHSTRPPAAWTLGSPSPVTELHEHQL